MIIILSNHVRKRIEERHLDEQLVRKCLTDADLILESKDSEKIGVMKLNGRVLVVVFKKTDDVFFVITAFQSSKITHYFKH